MNLESAPTRSPALLLGLLLPWLLAMPAFAAPITWLLEGSITSVLYDGQPVPHSTIDALAAEGVAPGATFTGAFTFESTTPDWDPSDTFSDYRNGVISFSVEIEGWSIASPSGPYPTFINVSLNGLPSLPAFYSAATSGVATPDLFGAGFANTIELSFLDSDADVLSTDAMLLIPPDLLLLDPHDPATFLSLGLVTGLHLILSTEESFIDVTGELTSITLPEPGSVVLLGLGLGALAVLRRRR